MSDHHPEAVGAMMRLLEEHATDHEALAGIILDRIETAEGRGKGRIRELKGRVRLLERRLARTPRQRESVERAAVQAIRWSFRQGETPERAAKRVIEALRRANYIQSID